MKFETIRYEVEDRIATITLNRPDQLNAVSPLMVRELRDAYAAVESDDGGVDRDRDRRRAGVLRRRRRRPRSPTTAASSTTSPT